MAAGLIDFLPANIAQIIRGLDNYLAEELIEIRLRVNQPLQIITHYHDYFLNKNGQRVEKPEDGYIVSEKDLERAFLILTRNSLYAIERQLVEGFITIPGGHRVGFTGQAIMENGELKTIKNINSLNYRLTREMIGIAEGVIDKIYDSENDYIYNTLIISPPICGKTTLLRDLIRLISQGVPEIGLRGRKIAVVDERSEIAGAYNGIAQNRIGNRTDLLDNCPKARGMLILIRSMSPEVLAVDEIGREEDVRALEEAINAGVSLLATVHGRDIDSVKRRPSIRHLIDSNLFQRYIILSRKKGIGTIEGVKDNQGKEVV
ncbi:MAG: stage sporulation protein [Halanaerobiales bacterium]|nr:stage sporulation protein [Halanaerobiales bacterium]